MPEAPRSLGGRLDDELALTRRDPAGPATRPLRVQGVHPPLVEGVDHLPHSIRARLHELGDDGDIVAAGRGQHDEGSAPLHDRAVGLPAAANDSLQLAAFLVGEPADPHRFAHAEFSATRVPERWTYG